MSRTPRPPAISVAICLFNSSRFIDETLASVLAQTMRDYELVIVDDGSTDECVSRIERDYRDPRVRIIRQPHQGLSVARRTSIAAARADYVAFLDHDDLWRSDKLEIQLRTAIADPSIALLFSDCEYIDEVGNSLGRLSDQYGLGNLDMRRPHAELLRRGCFVWQSTVVAKTAVLKHIGSFDPQYPYIADYDTWLRISRRHRLHYTPEVLASWRQHQTQFTNRCPDITLADHRRLLGPLSRTASIPRPIRIALGDRLLGQHRVSARALWRQKRFGLAVRAALGMFSYPDRLLAFCLGAVAETQVVGPLLLNAYKAVRGRIRRRTYSGSADTRGSATHPAHIWIDGSSLGVSQTGHFSLITELIRALLAGGCVVHVPVTPAGRTALLDRLDGASSSLHCHDARWRRILCTALRRPRGMPPHPNTIEVIVWRGRFRWRGSRRVAILQDLTTRLHPEWHTPRNVTDTDAFVAYALRHADTVATISDHSRRDILDHLTVFPDAVSIVPMPVHPCFVSPSFDPAILAAHHVDQPYILYVGCIEPRKNLARLVRAFELLQCGDASGQPLLVIVGPQGWDERFSTVVRDSGAHHRIRRLGFVPVEQLPSLYHFAAAVVYPSLYEGFGLPVLEAMCASSVVLTSRASAMSEVLGKDGMLFDPHRAETIAEAVRRALDLTDAESAAYRRQCRARADDYLQRAAKVPILPGLPAGAAAVVR